MKSAGERIIESICTGRLLRANCSIDEEHPLVIIWAANAVEQLESLVAEIAVGVKEQDGRGLGGMLLLRTEDHPERGGRRPEPGETGVSVALGLEDGRELLMLVGEASMAKLGALVDGWRELKRREAAGEA